MKSKVLLNGLIALALLLALGGGILMMTQQAQAQAPQNAESPEAALGTAFTYQGRLENASGPVDGTCDFKFSLWDANSGGAQKGSEQTVAGVNVSNGYFSASLNDGGEFGIDAFQGEARHLQIKVKCSGDSNYVLMSGRAALNAAPYALSLRPEAVINGTSSGNILSAHNNGSGVGVRGEAVNGHGVEGVVDWTSGGAGYGVYGYGGFYGYGGGFESATTDVPTVQIKNLNYTAGGPALQVYGTTVVTASVSGIGASSSVLYVHNSKSSGVAHGIYGQTDAGSGYGVYGQGPTIGVYGNGSTAGVYGEGSTSGVHGITSGAGAHGVYGQNSNSSSGYGVYGRGFRGVEGYSDSADGAGGFFRNMSATASENSVGMWAGSYYGDIIQGHELDSDGTSMNRRFRVTYQGDVYIDGAYYNTGADFAEMLPATEGLEPGDVLIIGPDGQLARSTEAYQSTVVGIYSTKPGFLGGAEDEADQTGKVPLAIVGIVPVKVSTENGSIAPGDLLVASSTPGHAMKAGDNPQIGTVIGKALQSLESGTGVIRMLVTLQ